MSDLLNPPPARGVQGLDAAAFRAVFEAARDAIVVADDDARYVEANPAACELFGLPREQLLGRAVADFVSSNRTESTWRQWHAFKQGSLDRGEFVLRRPDGQTVILEYQASRNFLPGLHLSILRDVTLRAEVDRDSALLHELVAVGQSLASQLDLDTLVQSVVDAGRRLTRAAFGALFYNVADEHGQTLSLYVLSGAPREAFARFPAPRNTLVFGPTFEGSHIVRSDDITRDPRYGQNLPYHGMPPGHLPVRSYLAVPVITRSGEAVGSLLFGHPDAAVFGVREEEVLRGVASQAAVAIDNARLYQRAQQALAAQREMVNALQQADQHKDEFLAMLAHELRNPLAPLTNAHRLLERAELLTDAGRAALAMAQRQTRQLTRLVDELLEVSRVSRGQITLSREPMLLAAAVYNAAESVSDVITARGQSLRIVVPDEPVKIVADPVRIVQILENLVANASKYSPKGGEIRVEVEHDPQTVQIRVADRGVGIEPDKIDRLFELFSQIDVPLDRTEGGLGVGLVLVKRLVELHGGTVAAASAGKGKGTTFTVRLPRPEPSR